jgi:hypothetical protein
MVLNHSAEKFVFEELAQGRLLWQGQVFAAGNYISLDDIADGKLVYEPVADSVVISLAAPGSGTFEEQRREYGGLRATAHRIEATVTISALGITWARKSALVASLRSTVPAWMRLDLMPFLSSSDGPDDDSNPVAAREPSMASGTVPSMAKTATTDSFEHLFIVEGTTTRENRNAG